MLGVSVVYSRVQGTCSYVTTYVFDFWCLCLHQSSHSLSDLGHSSRLWLFIRETRICRALWERRGNIYWTTSFSDQRYGYKEVTKKIHCDPLTLMSDQGRISPRNINTLSTRSVMRIKKKISLGIISWSNT